MRTELLQRRVENANMQFRSPSDKLTEFYEMTQIARSTISEINQLRQEMQQIIDLSKVHGYAGKMRMKHVAEMALRRAI